MWWNRALHVHPPARMGRAGVCFSLGMARWRGQGMGMGGSAG